jgi:heme exporter protein CcmD
MSALIQFLEMGGYAIYVWPSFLASALALGWITRRALVAERETLHGIAARERARASAGGSADR